MTIAVPGPNPADVAERRRTLRKYQWGVTGLLILAAVIFFACSWWQHHNPDAPTWVGYVRAGAEAGMVGGLADWFAVTAIFRYPMGIPIPHTALIPRKKDQVGEALSTFVEEQFLTPDALSAKISENSIPEKAGAWLSQPRNAELAAHKAAEMASRAVNSFDHAEAEELIRTQILDRMMEPEWGPPVGRLLEGYIADGKAEPLVDDLIDWAHGKVLTMEDAVIELVDEKMPAWLPRFARGMAGDKVYVAIVEWASEVKYDKNHDVRQAIRRNLALFAQKLQDDPEMVARVEGIKQEMMNSEQVQAMPGAAWEAFRSGVAKQAADPESFLRTKIATEAQRFGTRVQTDPKFLQQANDIVDKAARWAAENFAGDIISIIPETIKRWDATEASENIELLVGKDLQFIRLNGTVVGTLAGLVIYTVNHLVFGA
ncbi:TPA: DUF445 family protein [Corynebacterium striatum]|nr:DUF445 family protein [Corynebacterium striatum]